MLPSHARAVCGRPDRRRDGRETAWRPVAWPTMAKGWITGTAPKNLPNGPYCGGLSENKPEGREDQCCTGEVEPRREPVDNRAMNNEQLAFFQSQSNELAARANRVRQIIGDAHWYTDGAFKEALLLDAIRARLSAGFIARRGFVLSHNLSVCSKEQDCVIHDRTKEAPIFEAADFHMVSPVAVSAIISVKTRLNKGEFQDALAGLASAANILALSPHAPNPFIGLFSFESESGAQDQTVMEWIRDLFSHGVLPIIRRDPLQGDRALGPFWVLTLYDRCIKLVFNSNGGARCTFYRVANVAAATFLFVLERTLAEFRGGGDSPWNVLEDPGVATMTHAVDL